MRLGIMQPYFLPYLGYISLIKHTDEFILFDSAQFIRHGWIERNRILKPGEGWQYIAVPLVKHGQKTAICSVEINNNTDWKNKLLAQLVHYKKAPYYNKVIHLLEAELKADYTSIVKLDKVLLEAVCKYLGIDTPIKIFTEMNLQIEVAVAADEWALNICKAIPAAKEYWNPPGGIDFFDREKYVRAGIDLRFQKINLPPYYQGRLNFEKGLSIVDVMMFNSIEIINDMLDDFELL